MNEPRVSAFGRPAGRQLPFSESLASVAEVPEKFRQPLHDALAGRSDTATLIIQSPAFSSYTFSSLANLLVLTEHDWLLLVDTGHGVKLQSAPYAATRLMELYGVLLQGRFSIEYGAAAPGEFALQFNMVSADLFREALTLILNGESSAATAPAEAAPNVARLAVAEGLPFKFLSALDELVPANDTLRSLTAWETLKRTSFGRSRCEVPAGFVAVFDNWVCVVTEASAEDGQKGGAFSTYGKIATYLNRRFPFAWKSSDAGDAVEFVIWVGSGSQISELVVRVPAENAPAVETVLGVLDRSGGRS